MFEEKRRNFIGARSFGGVKCVDGRIKFRHGEWGLIEHHCFVYKIVTLRVWPGARWKWPMGGFVIGGCGLRYFFWAYRGPASNYDSRLVDGTQPFNAFPVLPGTVKGI
eukprot:6420585-Amphidinium_carterae.1